MEPALQLKPITPLADLIPLSYVIIKKSQQCLCCGAKHEFTELYLKSRAHSHYFHKSVLNLHRLDRKPQWNLPIETVSQKREDLPFCHSCNLPTLNDLPPPPRPEPTRAPFTIVQTPPRASAARSNTDGRKTSTRPTIDDIFSRLES